MDDGTRWTMTSTAIIMFVFSDLRAIPMVAVSFSTYELVKQMLQLDTGIPIKTG